MTQLSRDVRVIYRRHAILSWHHSIKDASFNHRQPIEEEDATRSLACGVLSRPEFIRGIGI